MNVGHRGNRHPSRPGRGFTLIELLVVILIITILMALLLPAVQSAREAARRVQCQNNLKQIGLAIRNFNAAKQALPPSRVCNHKATWAVEVLPYMEQQGLYDLWRPGICYYDQPAAFRETVVSTYICSARSQASKLLHDDEPDPMHGHPQQGYSGAVGDYTVVSGSVLYKNWDQIYGNGAMIHSRFSEEEGWPYPPLELKRWHSLTKLASIRDGTSHTLLAGEQTFYFSRRRSIYNGDRNQGGIVGPTFPIAKSMDDTTFFGGEHMGDVCIFVFADGSVHALNNSTNVDVLARLATRAGAESIDDSEY